MKQLMRALLAICFVVGAVACGGDDDDKSSSTNSTVATTTPPPTTTTTISAAELAERELASDAAKIRQQFEDINAAFQTSEEAGIAALTDANYHVGVTNFFTTEQCLESGRANPTTDIIEVHDETMTLVPGFTHPIVNGVVEGRVYEFSADVTYTDKATGNVSEETVDGLHATVLPDGTVRVFYNCSPS